MREPVITNKHEYLTAMAIASKSIGCVVAKRSGKPFKSSNKRNTVVGVCINPKSKKIAYIFDEDESIVDCSKCTNIVSNIKQRKRSITIACEADKHYADYDIAITADERGGIGQQWNQQVEMTYGYLSGWTENIKGTLAGHLHDDGDGIRVDLMNNTVMVLDYSQFSVLFAMLLYYNNASKLEDKPSSYRIHKEQNL